MRYCVALLALWFTPAALAQSVAPQEGATVIDAESIEGVGDLEVTARGSAEIRRDDVTIFGDMLRYNSEFGRVQGEGPACGLGLEPLEQVARQSAEQVLDGARVWIGVVKGRLGAHAEGVPAAVSPRLAGAGRTRANGPGAIVFRERWQEIPQSRGSPVRARPTNSCR